MQHRHDVAFEDPCPVCGDKVSGYHYGLLTCESCKGFFKRTVQNNKKYICAENQECRIDKTQRKRCPFCRFQKCIHVGMRLEAVRADRMRGGRNKFGPMYKRDRALKLQRRALIEVGGFKLESKSPLAPSVHQMDVTFPGGLHPAGGPDSITLATAQSDCISQQPPPAHSLLPFSSGAVSHLHSTPSWAAWSEHRCSHAGSPGSAAGMGPDQLRSGQEGGPRARMPDLVMDFLRCDQDDFQLQSTFSTQLLQTSWQIQGQPSTFSLVCLMADQTLFSIVEWARSSVFFKQLKVSDQMTLLHSSWSALLLLDAVSRQVLHGREGRVLLATGQEMELADIASHTGPALASLVQRGQELVERFQILKVDRQEFCCLKVLVLFNADVEQVEEHHYIAGVQQQVEGALLDYTLCSSTHPAGRVPHLLLALSELRSLGALAEDVLLRKYLGNEVPSNSLLSEMLQAKRSQHETLKS